MATGQMNHYQVLMLDPGVDMDLMTTVYRRLVQRYQAASGGDASAFERISAIEAAYGILRDPFRRARYDAELAQQAERDEQASADVAPVQQAMAAAPTALAARVAVPVMTQAAPAPRTVPVNVLDFGRYAGWSLRQIAARDPDYLQWLLRSPGGRQYRAQITAILQPR